MPKLTRIQYPRLLNEGTDRDGIILTPEIFIPDEVIIEGGGNIPRMKPPIVGTEASEELFGTDGNDTMYGYGGNDGLHGGKGADKMYGGDGDETYYVDNVGDVVIENAGEGKDTVRSDIDYKLGANVENLYLDGPNAFNGTGNELDNTLIGNSNSNMLFGNDGNDHLDGRGGADGMLGGDGHDSYIVDNAGDVIWEFEDKGDDHVWSSVSYELSSHVERLTLLNEGGAINGTGNDLDNNIDGNSSKNILKGGLGNDWLNGKEGNDTTYGGDGNDNFIVDSINDVVVEYDDQGYDTVHSTATHFLADNVETLMLKTEGGAINGYGNELDNHLYGNNFANDLGGYAGTDTIKGYGGKDTVDGGTGNDYLWGGSEDDTFQFHGSFGHDWIQDFKAGGDHDIIELDHNQFADFAAVQAAMVQGNGQTTIMLDANHSIVLTGVNAADLQASDFQFV
jgi:serralysin